MRIDGTRTRRTRSAARPAARRVLVAGGAGLIGSHVCARLLEAGDRVLCVDNFRTGSRANVRPLASQSRFTIVEHDIVEPLQLDCDLILNFACPASPRHYQVDPVYTAKVNVLGALHLLELAHRLQVPILQASTSEVYGDPAVHPQTEAYWGHVNPIGPRACYDEGKRCAETLFMDFHRQYGTPIKIARIFNTYGPNMHPDDGRVVSNFIVQALGGEPITLYGDGTQTRSFCYVDDTVAALLCMADTPPELTGPINIGNATETRMIDLARLVLELTASASPIVFEPLPVDDPVQRRPDLSRARGELAWQPSVSLRAGLARTIEYFDRLLLGGATGATLTASGAPARNTRTSA
ncbi:MAG: UDP-glucuronic acid decarboxylase family protein [Burkholderiaceae bacterium]|jgi:UDP-glucuronate decarboxylase|nr:UDP-glucuronic acid decarboxylase family protein [Burkholderiaceae bacterium]